MLFYWFSGAFVPGFIVLDSRSSHLGKNFRFPAVGRFSIGLSYLLPHTFAAHGYKNTTIKKHFRETRSKCDPVIRSILKIVQKMSKSLMCSTIVYKDLG